jgi:hypothetical protein
VLGVPQRVVLPQCGLRGDVRLAFQLRYLDCRRMSACRCREVYSVLRCAWSLGDTGELLENIEEQAE